jgi:nucleotide-binding universal stress UspA family protein
MTKITEPGATTTKSQRSTFDSIPEYKRILVPYDGSQMSDKALSHAIYLSTLSDAEIIILNVLEGNVKTESSVSATLGEGQEGKSSSDLEITMAGDVKKLIEEKMRLCREAGVKSQVSYQIQAGNPFEKIVRITEEKNVDLIIMASNKIGSSLRAVGSTARKIIDSVKNLSLLYTNNIENLLGKPEILYERHELWLH